MKIWKAPSVEAKYLSYICPAIRGNTDGGVIFEIPPPQFGGGIDNIVLRSLWESHWVQK